MILPFPPVRQKKSKKQGPGISKRTRVRRGGCVLALANPPGWGLCGLEGKTEMGPKAASRPYQSSFPGDKHHRGPKKKPKILKLRGPAFFAFRFSLGIGRSFLLPQGFGRSFLSAPAAIWLFIPPAPGNRSFIPPPGARKWPFIPPNRLDFLNSPNFSPGRGLEEKNPIRRTHA